MMPEMTLNGVDIKAYNARLLNYSPGGTVITNNIASAGEQLFMPMLYGVTLAPRTLTVTLTFFPKKFGENSRKTSIRARLSRAAENITRFESEIIGKVVEIHLPDGYCYTALLNSISAPDFDATGEHDVTYTFSAIRHLPEERITVKPNGMINCKSNTKTAFKLTMKLPDARESVTVCGVTVNNISADYEIIIDSVNGLITENGKNKFNETDLIEFPYLQAGKNIIDCTAGDAEIHIIYTPILA